MKTSKIRIIGGSLKGNHISFPSSSKLRPTSNKLREILFNWLNFEIAGFKCVDCFSGSGALGIEAISRGAQSATFIEKTPKFAASIEANLERLNISEKCEIKIKNAFDWLKEDSLEYLDLIFNHHLDFTTIPNFMFTKWIIKLWLLNICRCHRRGLERCR